VLEEASVHMANKSCIVDVVCCGEVECASPNVVVRPEIFGAVHHIHRR
jgi:hypothetical protein